MRTRHSHSSLISHSTRNLRDSKLEEAVDYRHQWTLKGVNALAGRVPVDDILTASQLPGVVMLELDGILTVTNGDTAALHGVETAWEQTGYNGSSLSPSSILD